MAYRFTTTVPLNMFWRGLALQGAAGKTFTIPDDLYADFVASVPVGGTVTWSSTPTAQAAVAALTATAKIQGYDPASAGWYDILASIATLGNAEATTVLTVLPSATAEANVTINAGLPATWRVIFTPTDADSCTYSIGYSYIG